MSRQSNSSSTSVRPRRSPLTKRTRLGVRNKEEGYHYRVVNDVDNRVQDLQDLGYEIDPTADMGNKRVDNSTPMGSVSTISVGHGVRAVTMRIKKEYFEEDQKAKQEYVDQSEGKMGLPKQETIVNR